MIRDDCITLCEEVATIVRRAASQLGTDDRRVERSLPRDVKIAGDRRVHEFLAEQLHGYGWPILSEEAPIDLPSSGPCWVVDPIDGSMNFARQIPLSCVSVALWIDGGPKLGVVCDITRAELFTGIAAETAFLTDRPITVSDVVHAHDAVLCTGFPAEADFSSTRVAAFVRDIQRFRKVRLLGSAALSLAYVAAGRADAYIEHSIAIWDVAAGLALVSGAGGVFSWKPAGPPYRYDVQAFAHESIGEGRRLSQG